MGRGTDGTARPVLGLDAVPLLIWLVWLGSFWITFGRSHFAFDSLAAFSGLLLTIGVRWLVSFRRGGPRGPPWAYGVFAAIVSWLLVSAHYWADLLMAQDDHIESPHVLVRPTDPGTKRLGIALSGGGYRAALFHAGVLDALAELGVAPTNYSMVSGGAISGLFIFAGGSPSQFLRIVQEDRLNIQRHIGMFPTGIMLACPARIPFTQIRLLPFCDYSRLDAQAELLDLMLFHNLRLSDFKTGSDRVFIVNTTDILDGVAVALGPKELLLRGRERPHFFRVSDVARLAGNANLESLAYLAATSGAFPGAFPSIDVDFEVRVPQYAITPFPARSDSDSVTTGKGRAELHFKLADGGIIDNSGLRTLFDLDFLAYADGRGQCLPYPLDRFYRPPLAFPPFLYPPSTASVPFKELIDANMPREANEGLRPGAEWRIDFVIGAQAGAPIKSELPSGGFSELNRAIELASSFSRYSDIRAICEAPAYVLDPDVWALPGMVDDVGGIPGGYTTQSLSNGSSDARLLLPHLRSPTYDAVLEWLVRQLPDQADAQERYSSYRRSQLLRKTMGNGPGGSLDSDGVGEPPPWARSLPAIGEWLDSGSCSESRFFEDFPMRFVGNCEEMALGLAIQLDLQSSLLAFRRTSTLYAQIDADDAAAIFRLGKYVTFLSWAELQPRFSMPRNALPTGNFRPMPGAPLPNVR